MSNIDWFERVKENFSSMLEEHSGDDFFEMYEDGVFTLDFTEFDKERTIWFKLAEQNVPIHILKYSEAESYFYTEYQDSMCNCKDEDCIVPVFKRRLIIDTAEVLVMYIENEIMSSLYEFNESLEPTTASNVVSIKKNNVKNPL